MSNIKTDIQHVYNVLNHEKLCSDRFKSIVGNRCNIEKLKIDIKDIPRGTKPNVKLLCVILTINYQFDKNGLLPEKYDFCFEVSAYNGKDKHKTSWHFDYDTTLSSEFIHPCFHLTHGGKLMDDVDFGKTLLLPVPRIAYPPMDFVLGIDFILSNFLKKAKYEKLRSKKEYNAAVKNSQEWLWKPYMQTIANHWDKRIELPVYHNSSELIPTLL